MKTQQQVKDLIVEAYQETVLAREVLRLIMVSEHTTLKVMSELRHHLNAACAKIEAAETIINNSIPSEEKLKKENGEQ